VCWRVLLALHSIVISTMNGSPAAKKPRRSPKKTEDIEKKELELQATKLVVKSSNLSEINDTVKGSISQLNSTLNNFSQSHLHTMESICMFLCYHIYILILGHR
jgi:hypothetical protein